MVGGLGRFGYTLILPSIRDDLGLSYTQSGFLVTANFAGYLVAAFVGGLLNSRLGVRGASVAGLVVMLLGMIGSAFAPGYGVLLALQIPIGFGTGTTMIASISTLPAWFPARLRGLIAGLGNGAAGLGIVMSGLFVPPLLQAFGDSGWRQTWIAFSIGCGVALIVGTVFLRRRPVSPGPVRPAGPRRALGSVYRTPLYWKLAALTPLMGAVTAVYGTYFGAYGTRELRIDPTLVGGIWSVVGVLSVLSGIVWGLVSDRLGRKPAMIAVLGVQSLASAILVVASGGGAVTLAVSGLIAGLTLFGAASVMTAVMVDAAEPDMLPAVGGMMAIGNGIGQLSGPALAGSATDLTGSLAAAYIFAAAVSLLAIAVVAVLPLARSHHAPVVLTRPAGEPAAQPAPGRPIAASATLDPEPARLAPAQPAPDLASPMVMAPAGRNGSNGHAATSTPAAGSIDWLPRAVAAERRRAETLSEWAHLTADAELAEALEIVAARARDRAFRLRRAAPEGIVPATPNGSRAGADVAHLAEPRTGILPVAPNGSRPVPEHAPGDDLSRLSAILEWSSLYPSPQPADRADGSLAGSLATDAADDRCLLADHYSRLAQERAGPAPRRLSATVAAVDGPSGPLVRRYRGEAVDLPSLRWAFLPPGASLRLPPADAERIVLVLRGQVAARSGADSPITLAADQAAGIAAASEAELTAGECPAQVLIAAGPTATA